MIGLITSLSSEVQWFGPRKHPRTHHGKEDVRGDWPTIGLRIDTDLCFNERLLESRKCSDGKLRGGIVVPLS